MRKITAALLFAATWLIWSGIYSPLLLGLGVLSCGLVLLLAKRTGFFSADVYTLHLGLRLPRFWLWLFKELVLANIAVARVVLSRRMPIEPTLVSIDASHLSPAAQATLANSITLTPGTVCHDIDHGRIEVHCLTRANAEDLQNGEMLRRISALGLR
ncbi:MAG: Na+/H+ antiporter subunit E [Woeseiaceae bacterium]